MKRIVFALALLITSWSSASLTDGLVGYWPFDGDAKDYSGNGNNGNLHGVSFTNGRRGSSLAAHFGGNDYVSVPSSGKINSIFNFSAAMWIKTSAYDNRGINKTISLISKGSSDRQFGVQLGIDTNNLSFFQYVLGDRMPCPKIPINTWTHIAVTRSGLNASLYINGVGVAGGTSKSYPEQHSGNLEIGRDTPREVEYFHGEMSDVCLFNRVLSAAEVSAIYNGGLKLGKVVFNANAVEVEGTMPSLSVLSGTQEKLPENAFRRHDGYVFQGWAKSKSDADNGIVEYQDEEEITIESDMTLYAVWANPVLTLAAESANWSSGSITLCCTDADTSGTAHKYTLEYKNASGVWEEVDGAKNKLATKGQDANGQEVLIAKLTDNTFWSRLGGLPPVEYRVKDENGRLSEGCMTRTRYGLAVGLGKYDSKLRDKYGFSEMDICRNNATLAGEIMTQHGGGIEGGNMTVLTDGDAKVKDIGEEWRRLAQDKTKTGDVVFFFIATHGGSWGALAAYDKLYTVSQFQKDIEPFRTGNRSGVKLVVLLLNCHSEAMTSEVKSINFEYGSICTANIIYVAVAGAKESEYNLHRDDEEDAGWFRRRTYSEGGEFFLNQGLKKRQADVLRTLQGIEGEFGNKDGVVDLLECVKYMDALTIGVSDRSQTHAQYDKNKCEAMKKTVVVVGEQSSGMSAPPAPHMISVTVESGIVNILLDDVGSAQYYKFYYYDVVAKETHWVSNSRGGTITMEKAMFKTADMATYEDRKYFVPLENDTEYNFYAIAVNAGGQSPKSNVITMRTMPATRNPRYRVSLMAEGGKVSPTHIDVESGLPVGQLPVPTREGRTFLGWFTESQGGTEVAPETTITADIKYYARWSNPATEIYLPGEWLQCYPAVTLASGGDAGIATDMLSANGNRTVGECYALGVDPEDPNDDLKIAGFKMKDGKPEITLNHTKDGSGNSFEDRVKILGKAELTDAEWQEVPPEGNPAHRFFKVGVEMP